MDIGTGISIAGGIVGLIFAAEKYFGRSARTEVAADRGEKVADGVADKASELDKQTSLLKAEFVTLTRHLTEQNEALRNRDKEIGDRVHVHAGKLQEHDGRLHNMEASFNRLEKAAVDALNQMAQANSQGATAVQAVAKALDRLNDSVDVSQRLARLEGLVSSYLDHNPNPPEGPRRRAR